MDDARSPGEGYGGYGEDSYIDEYHRRLHRRLSCLIAVFGAVINKLRLAIELRGDSAERLELVCTNLEKTLGVCLRAKDEVEARLRSETACDLGRVVGFEGSGQGLMGVPMAEKRRDRDRERPGKKRRMTYRDYVEFSSLEEFRHFQKLPPIDPKEVKKCDIDDLLHRLLGD